MRQFRRLHMQRLDDRRLLTTFGIPWPEATALTLSFAPDGTAAGQQSSALFRTLNDRLPTQQWEQTVLRAFQTWAVQTGINIGVVADGGQPFGTVGLKQGDPRFGDIRIGALPLAPDVLAVADPYDPFVANTSVGDVYLNSSIAFDSGGTGTSSFDLFSVLLHEAGHTLGLDHSLDASSAMFEGYQGVRTGLAPSDVAAVQALYGRRADAAGNSTFSTATILDLGSSAAGEPAAAVLDAAIATPTDSQVYKLIVPTASQSLDFKVVASGISLLVPHLTVYNAAGTVVASAVATDPLSNDLQVSIDHVVPGETYYVKVAAARSDVFGVGSYKLEVDSRVSSPSIQLPDGATWWAAAPGGIPSNSVQVLASSPGYLEHTYYEIHGTLDRATPAHLYQVRSADIGPNLSNVMTVAVDTSDGNNARVEVTVFDDQGVQVPSHTVFSGPGHLEIQVPRVGSNREYQVAVRGDSGVVRDSHFYLDVDFDQDASSLPVLAAGLLSQGQSAMSQELVVAETQQLNLVLGASHWDTEQRAGLRMTIVDDNGQAIYTQIVADGAIRSGNVLLNQGHYVIRFERADGSVGTPIRFELRGYALSDPIGPQLRDTTHEPLNGPGGLALSQLTFYWLPFGASDRLPNPSPSISVGGNGSVNAADTPRGVAAQATASTMVGASLTKSTLTSAAHSSLSDLNPEVVADFKSGLGSLQEFVRAAAGGWMTIPVLRPPLDTTSDSPPDHSALPDQLPTNPDTISPLPSTPASIEPADDLDGAAQPAQASVSLFDQGAATDGALTDRAELEMIDDLEPLDFACLAFICHLASLRFNGSCELELADPDDLREHRNKHGRL